MDEYRMGGIYQRTREQQGYPVYDSDIARVLRVVHGMRMTASAVCLA